MNTRGWIAVVVAVVACAVGLVNLGGGRGVGVTNSARQRHEDADVAATRPLQARWLGDSDVRYASAWSPRVETGMWPPGNGTLPAVVEELTWSSRRSWQEALLRRVYPAVIRGSPVSAWAALRKWAAPHTGASICSAVGGDLANVMTPLPSATPTNTFYYLNPNAPMTMIPDAMYIGNKFYDVRNASCPDFFERINHGDVLYYSRSAAATSLKLLQDMQPLFPIYDDDKPYRMNFWAAGAGATSRMHFDSSHNLFVQLVGRKRILLVPPDQWDELFMYPRLHPASRQSQLNLEDKGAPALRVQTVVLEPGDVLFMPAMYFHQVVALENSISINMYHVPEWKGVLLRIFESWPSLPSYRGMSPDRINPCVIRQLVEYCTEVVRLGVIRMSTREPHAVLAAVRAFFATVFHTRYATLGTDPTFARGRVFNDASLDRDLAWGCSLVGKSDAETQECSDVVDDVAVSEVARVVALWLRRIPAGIRAMIAADYLEQVVYKMLGARHVGSFFRSCVHPNHS